MGSVRCPWTEKLFKVDTTAKKLENNKREIFHSAVMKAMFLCKRGRTDVQPAITFLASRVQDPNENDWKKLTRVLGYLKNTREDILHLEADNSATLKWYVDVSFAVHHDMKSHTGSSFTLGKGAVFADSTKQKVNARSSTEVEMVGVDDRISKILWTKKFIENQGFNISLNIIYQDNTSTIKLATNGRSSLGKRTRHFDIKYFYVTDLIGRNEVTIEYCSTDDMLADYYTKPLVGAKFVKFRKRLLNL